MMDRTDYGFTQTDTDKENGSEDSLELEHVQVQTHF